MSITTPTLARGVRKHPSGPGYQVRIRPFPDRTLATADEANEYAVELRRRKRQGILVAPEPDDLRLTTLAEATEDYLRRLETVGGRNRRPYSEAGMREARGEARPWLDGEFANVALAALDVRKLDLYFEERAAKTPRRAAGEWHVLRGALLLAQRRGERFDPRLLSLDVKRAKAPKRVGLTLAEADYLAGFAPEYVRRLFPLAATLGMRIGELLAADESWLDLKAKTLTVPEGATKERRERVIPLLDREAKLLREQLLARGGPSTLLFPRRHGTPWRHSHFWRVVLVPTRTRAAVAWRKERGLAEGAATPFDAIAPHDFRRSAATILIEAGMPADVAAARLGHKDAGFLLLDRYATTRQERLVAEVERLDAAGGLA